MKLLDGARTIIRTSLNVKPSEKVLILTDTGRDPSIAKALFEAAIQANSNPAIAVMTEKHWRGTASLCR